MDDEPYLELEFKGERIRGDRTNLSLFTFAGELASHNHVFLVLKEMDNDEVEATHIWQDQPAYTYLMKFIAEFNLPMHLNLNEIAQCDLDAREAYIGKTLMSDLTDYIPDGWDEPRS